MREAIGGTYLVKMFMLFLVIYVIFIAMALNYAKAFKTKNGIIDSIEVYEGYNDLSKAAIEEFLDKVGYNVPTQGPGGSYASENPDARCFDRGYCIEEVEKDGRIQARVITFIQFNFFDMGDNYDFTSIIKIPPIVISGDIQQYSPDEFWKEEYE